MCVCVCVCMQWTSIKSQNFAATWMNLQGEVSQIKKGAYDITYVWNLKKKYNKLVNITKEQIKLSNQKI